MDNYFKAGKSLIIYHHLTRNQKGKKQVGDIKYKLNQKFNKNSNIRALWFHGGTARIFFIIANGNHKDTVNKRIDRFLKNFENNDKKETHFEEI